MLVAFSQSICAYTYVYGFHSAECSLCCNSIYVRNSWCLWRPQCHWCKLFCFRAVRKFAFDKHLFWWSQLIRVVSKILISLWYSCPPSCRIFEKFGYYGKIVEGTRRAVPSWWEAVKRYRVRNSSLVYFVTCAHWLKTKTYRAKFEFRNVWTPHLFESPVKNGFWWTFIVS